MAGQPQRAQDGIQCVEMGGGLRPRGQHGARTCHGRFGRPEALGQGQQRGRSGLLRPGGKQLAQAGQVAGLQQLQHGLLVDPFQLGQQQAGQPQMVDVQAHRTQFGQCQRLQQQIDDLDVGLDAGMAVDLGTDLDGLA